jgi:hypothetical protein
VCIQGNTGKEDDVVQTYMVQASEGDVGSMLALAEMNYFGSRGIPRVRYCALNWCLSILVSYFVLCLYLS